MRTLIITPCFGFDGTPYFPPNNFLAQEAVAQAGLRGEPIYTDPQIEMSLGSLQEVFGLKVKVYPYGKALTVATRELFKWVADDLGNLDDVQAIIVAAPQHLARCVWCANRSGFKHIELPKFIAAPDDEASYWAPGNLHWQTRGPRHWAVHESINWALMCLMPQLYGRLAKKKTR